MKLKIVLIKFIHAIYLGKISMKNIARNFFYQVIFQLLKILMPIITIPIVSNAIGPKGIGIFNYTNSIVQYFVLLAGLGISIYANREIAIAWQKKLNVSELFWEIFIFKFFVSSVVFIFYIIFILFLPQTNFLLIQSLILLGVVFDISWFFMGIEDFKKTSMTNLFVQIIVFFSIILFVKDSNDTFKYTIIQCLGMLLPQILIWKFIFKYINFTKIDIKNIFRHFKYSIQFFIPQVAIILYTNLNKTLLGFFIGSIAVGYYSNSVQLNTVFITIITTLDLVLLPHMSGLFAKNDNKKIIDMMRKTINLQLFFSIPIMFGILVVYDKLVPWFFGSQFLFIEKVIPIVSVLIVITPLGISISRQYLMPIGKIKEYNQSVIIGAMISIISNAILLPTIGFFGVIIANILSEFFVTFVRTRSFLKTTDFRFDMKRIIVYIFSGTVMCLITRVLTSSLKASIVTNIIQVFIAIIIYFGLVTLFKKNILLELYLNKKNN